MRKKLIILLTNLCISFLVAHACNCNPVMKTDDLENKTLSGANYVFFTGEILSVTKAYHLEVKVQVLEIFYGKTFIKDTTHALTLYFDITTSCGVNPDLFTTGTQVFFTTVYNALGRMYSSNYCDAYMLNDLIDTYGLRSYLEELKKEE